MTAVSDLRLILVLFLIGLLPAAEEGEFDPDAAQQSLDRFRQELFASAGMSRVDWMDMSNEQRLARLRQVAHLSGDALSLSAEYGLMVLKPITGDSYVSTLAQQVGRIPDLLMQAAPRKYAEARKAVQALGGDTEAFDKEMRAFSDKLLQALDVASDPTFIERSLE